MHRIMLAACLLTPVHTLSNNQKPLRIQVCQNKDCCKRWKYSSSLPQVLTDLLDDTAKVLHGVSSDPIQLAADLEFMSGLEVPSKLLAAVKVMDKAQSGLDPPAKERFLSSVIQALTADPDFVESPALQHAHLLRAQARLSKKRYDDALMDARQAMGSIYAAHAWRVMADAFEALGRREDAVEALKAMASCTPQLRTKVMREIEALQQQASDI